MVWSGVYDSFGNVQIGVETVKNNLRFAGQYYDAETGLHYNFNRYYGPVIGRYLRVDPAEDGLNLYVYVLNNPLIGIDPEGLMAVSSWNDFTGGLSLLPDALSSAYDDFMNIPTQIGDAMPHDNFVQDALATSVFTAGTVATYAAMAPVHLGSLIRDTFSWDLSDSTTTPLLGPIANNVALSTSNFIDHPNLVTSSQMVGAYSGAALLSLGGPQAIRSWRQNVANNYYAEAGWSEARIRHHLQGIDFSRSVGTTFIPQGQKVVQYQLPGMSPGNYFAPVGTPANRLGIYTSGRFGRIFSATENTTVLRSTAASMVDDFSVSGWKIQLNGGGTQYFSPNPNIFSPVQ